MNPISVAVEYHDILQPSVLAGIVEYNGRFLGENKAVRIGVAARDQKGVVVGGGVGRLYVDCFFLDLFWVSEECRGQGIGSRVLKAVEEEAKRLGAKAVLLDTFDFQAAPFYAKQGYVEEARLKAMVGGHDRIYMTKRTL